MKRYRGAQILPNKPRDHIIADLVDLASLGPNLVRWQLTAVDDPNWGSWTKLEYWDWLSRKLGDLDAILPVAEDLGIKILISMMTPYGGLKRTLLGRRVHRIFTERRVRQEFLLIWEHIAVRYKDSPQILGFQIINEPQVKRARKLKKLQRKALRKIRAHTPNKIVVMSSPGGIASRFGGTLYVPDDPYIWYSTNYYYPGRVTHQGIADWTSGQCGPPKHPQGAMYPSNVATQADLERELRKIDRFVRNHPEAQILIGEYGCVRWAGYPQEAARNWFRDVLELFEERGYHHSLHAWRECLCWSIEHTEVPNSDPCNVCGQAVIRPTNSRMQLFQEMWAKND